MKNSIKFLTALALATTISVQAKVKIAASLPDLASIAATVGGDQVDVFSIAKSNANPHFVEVLPSYMIKVSRVDLYLKAGLSLDQWADAIIEGSRNSKIQIVDCSNGVEVVEKPNGKVDASLGDVHPQGNPHYWLNPANGIQVAENIRDALKQADPSHAALYDANADKFKVEAEKRIQGWQIKMAPFKGASAITYHSSWIYFTHAFGIKVVGHVEPFPGIPPTAKHLQELVDLIKTQKVGILIQEPYYQDKDPKFLTSQTGIRVFRFTPSCDGIGPGDYLKHFDIIVDGLSEGK